MLERNSPTRTFRHDSVDAEFDAISSVNEGVEKACYEAIQHPWLGLTLITVQEVADEQVLF
jgi:hypothetical protein